MGQSHAAGPRPEGAPSRAQSGATVSQACENQGLVNASAFGGGLLHSIIATIADEYTIL